MNNSLSCIEMSYVRSLPIRISADFPSVAGATCSFITIEFGSERMPRSLLRGKRANDERYCSLRIEDSPQLAAESFKYYTVGKIRKTKTLREEKQYARWR
jgi:hypothetical protein